VGSIFSSDPLAWKCDGEQFESQACSCNSPGIANEPTIEAPHLNSCPLWKGHLSTNQSPDRFPTQCLGQALPFSTSVARVIVPTMVAQGLPYPVVVCIPKFVVACRLIAEHLNALVRFRCKEKFSYRHCEASYLAVPSDNLTR
jgi:hypothetical protein